MLEAAHLVHLDEPPNTHQIHSDDHSSYRLRLKKPGPYKDENIQLSINEIKINHIDGTVSLDQHSVANRVKEVPNSSWKINDTTVDKTNEEPSHNMTALDSTRNLKQVPHVEVGEYVVDKRVRHVAIDGEHCTVYIGTGIVL